MVDSTVNGERNYRPFFRVRYIQKSDRRCKCTIQLVDSKTARSAMIFTTDKLYGEQQVLIELCKFKFLNWSVKREYLKEETTTRLIVVPREGFTYTFDSMEGV